MRATPLAVICLSLSTTVLCGAALAAGKEKHSLDYGNQAAWKSALDQAQSPIDIVTGDAEPAQANEPRAIQLQHLARVPGQAQDTGYSVQFNSKQTQATIRGRHFRMVQYHIHADSEHTFDGKHFPAEGHFVFEAQDGRLAVIGVMYQEGRANPAVQGILDGLGHDGHDDPKSATLDIRPLLPRKLGYYHYLGSLTTPPLTQNVEWYVLKQPVSLSSKQLGELRKHYPRNNRSIQPLNGRPVIQFGG
jgi:carbonic anhydrase